MVYFLIIQILSYGEGCLLSLILHSALKDEIEKLREEVGASDKPEKATAAQATHSRKPKATKKVQAKKSERRG